MNGILIINKPKGYTSHDVVNVLRKKLNTKKIGHTGTLDPNATGVLPILVGQATKISKYLIEHDKTYIAELKLGEKSSTGDIEGQIIERQNIPSLNEEKINNTLKTFLGKQKQIPPIYSSIKINGKKAYEYARNGETIIIEPREIEIMKIRLINFNGNIITFEVKCSKGTYIRVLCEDIAKKLGTVGLMKNLIRTKVDQFDIKDAYTLENIKNEATVSLMSIEDVFKSKQNICLNNKKTILFFNGVKVSVECEDGIYRIYNNNLFLGLGIVNNNLLKRDVIIVDNLNNYV